MADIFFVIPLIVEDLDGCQLALDHAQHDFPPAQFLFGYEHHDAAITGFSVRLLQSGGRPIEINQCAFVANQGRDNGLNLLFGEQRVTLDVDGFY